MAHLVRVRTDANWTNGPVVLPAEFQAIDQNTYVAINGDTGGFWAPAAAIIIGGAGMWATGPWGISGGGAIQTLAASGKRFTFGDSDYFVLVNSHTAAVRSLRTNGLAVIANSGVYGTDTTGCASVVINAAAGAQGIWPLRVHHGATLTSVTVTFTVTVAHANVPAFLPKMRVYKSDASGTITPLKTTGVDASGYAYFPTPASGAAWTNAGAAQTFVYTCDAAQIVDVGKYSYFVEIVDESGANSLVGNEFEDFLALNSAIPDLRPQ